MTSNVKSDYLNPTQEFSEIDRRISFQQQSSLFIYLLLLLIFIHAT
jgi:hypothetical protein